MWVSVRACVRVWWRPGVSSPHDQHMNINPPSALGGRSVSHNSLQRGWVSGDIKPERCGWWLCPRLPCLPSSLHACLLACLSACMSVCLSVVLSPCIFSLYVLPPSLSICLYFSVLTPCCLILLCPASLLSCPSLPFLPVCQSIVLFLPVLS